MPLDTLVPNTRTLNALAGNALQALALAPTDTAPYVIDTVNHCVLLDGEPIRLTRKEFEVACLLFSNVGAAQSRAQLLEKLWQHAQQWDTRTIDTHVSRVRRKLDIGPHRGWQISTIYGFGYRLERVRVRAS